ncbi:MAG: fibronectin/fibrinogen-binding protein [Ruminococcaceae bacterium]|nr:fibronectin/fibrinogen-binding protein [Oscillospiraceae bacterium]
MALDGAFLACLRQELICALPEARIDKIHQPGREELLIALRFRGGNRKLYLSAGANSPRLHFTEQAPENPAQPPMFCMLLRKRLTGGRLAAIRQEGLERALYLDFDCISELGEPVRLTLAVEIMGRHSNIILIGPDGRIIDAIKRVDPAMSSVRPILPGLPYEVPPAPAGKYDLTAHTPDQIVTALKGGKDAPLSKALQAVTTGLSPLSCRELAYRATAGQDSPVSTLTPREWEKLADCLHRVRNAVLTGEKQVPYLITKPDGTPLEFSFQPIIQYGLEATGQEMESFSALLDTFYYKRAQAERMRVKGHDLLRVLTTATERVNRKLNVQRQELATAENRETLRLYGDLIHANMHLISPGASQAELVNYYDENCATITVPLDPALSAAANAQKYYKDYRRAQTAQRMLTDRIAAGEQEQIYLESVFDSLSRASSTRELEELRTELETEGYLRRQKGKQKPPPAMKPLTFRSDDGFTIYVGRNNLENDRLTLRVAKGSDVWLHTKNIPGSHVIVVCEGQTPPDRTLEQAAILAATHSKAVDSVQVPVDYAAAKYVKKPSGAKPGMVIYTDNRTAYVNPDPALCDRLKVE